MSSDGRLSIVGRLKDMVIRGGVNIFPVEIEQFLHGYHKVEDVQVLQMGQRNDRLKSNQSGVERSTLSHHVMNYPTWITLSSLMFYWKQSFIVNNIHLYMNL